MNKTSRWIFYALVGLLVTLFAHNAVYAQGSPGDSSTNLVYIPVTPCRVFDTRYSTAGILDADTQRNFNVAGTDGFTNQGGNSGGCGVPYGLATSVLINFVAVAPTGGGNLRGWAVASPQPVAPLAVVMNFSTDMPVLDNAVVVPICDPAATSCAAGDLRLQADWSSVHVVGDVMGYFQKLDLPAAIPMGSKKLTYSKIVSGNNHVLSTVDVSLPHNGSCLVTCDLKVARGPMNDNGGLLLKTLRHDIATLHDDVDDSYGMDAPFPSQHASVSTTYIWSMIGGKTYRFGCWFDASGDFIGDYVYPNVSWICR